jgi:hypothetical protein
MDSYSGPEPIKVYPFNSEVWRIFSWHDCSRAADLEGIGENRYGRYAEFHVFNEW